MAHDMLPVLIILTTLLVIATLLPLWRHPAWWVRVFDFPRLQLACGLVALIAATLALGLVGGGGGFVLLICQATCLAYQVWWIAPYSPLVAVEVAPASGSDPSRRLRILTANVLMTNRNAEGLIEHVRTHDPDLLVTLETDAWWEEQLAVLAGDYPHRIACALDNLYGMHVHSRLPLEDARTEFLVEPDVPSMHARIRLPCGRGVRAHFLHPAPPSPTENAESLERDAELLVVGRALADVDEPVVVAGDLNDVAWSATTRLFRRLSGLLDPRVGRGLYNTFHADWPFLRWPLDHLFHSRHFGLRELACLPAYGSDHFALLSEIWLEPDAADASRGLETEEGDRAIARRLHEAKDVSLDDVPDPG